MEYKVEVAGGMANDMGLESASSDIRQVVNKKVDTFIGEMCGLVSAGGEGLRLRPITIEHPKPLVEIGSVKRPLIYWSMLPMVLGGVTRFVIGLRHGADKIKERLGDGGEFSQDLGRPISITYVEEREPLGRAGCIKYGIENGLIDPRRPAVIFNASDILRLNLRSLVGHYLWLKACHGFNVVQVYTSGFRVQYGIGKVDFSTSQVIDFIEKPVFQDLANTACYIIYGRLEDFRTVQKIPSNPEDELIYKWLKEKTLGAYVIGHEDIISIKFQRDLDKVDNMDLDRYVRSAYE
ncbi:MAG: sugar phosphate nucleotidyltransferase [Candidatus Bathyarchaeia archaeon]